MSSLLDVVRTEHVQDDWTAETPAEAIVRNKALVEEMRERKRRCMPAEAKAREVIEQKIEEAETAMRRARLAEKHPGAKRLSLEPLGWTTTVVVPRGRRIGAPRTIQVPKLALLRVDRHMVQITAERYRDDGRDLHIAEMTDYPKPLLKQWKPMRLSIERAQVEREQITVEWTFGHAVPDDTKERIADYGRSGDFEAIFLMCEAGPDEWKVKTKRKPRPPRQSWLFDPLVVGWAADALWLLDKFDATPLEEYIASEFSSVPQLPAST